MILNRASKSMFQSLLISFFLAISTVSQAALVEVKELNNVLYAVYAAPNKVTRYDMTTETFLDDIRLNYSPNTAKFVEGTLYFSSGNNIYRLETDFKTQTFIASIAQHKPDNIIRSFVIVGDLIIAHDGRNRFLFNKEDNSFIKKQWDYQSSSNFQEQAISPTRLIKTSYGSCLQQDIDLSDYSFTSSSCENRPSQGSSSKTTEFKISGNTIHLFDGNNYSLDSLELISSYGFPYNSITTTSDNNVAIVREKTLSYLQQNGKLLGQHEFSSVSSYISSFGNNIFSLSSDNSTASIEKVSVSNLGWSIQTGSENNSNTFSYDLLASNKKDTLYFINNTEKMIHIWNKSTQTFSKTYPIYTEISAAESNNNKLYLGGKKGDLSYIDFSTDKPSQSYINFIGEEVQILDASAPNKILVKGKRNFYLFKSDNTLLDFKGETNSFVDTYYDNNDQSYSYLTDRYRYSFITSENKITFLNNRSSYDQVSWSNKFLGFSKNGQLLITQKGDIYQPGTYKSLNSLSEEISGVAWFNDNLVTIDKDKKSFNVWDQNYSKISTRQISGTNPVIFNLDEDLILIENLASGGSDSVSINKFGFSAENDQDNDSVTDLLDNCVTLANPDQLDSDGDNQGNACDNDDDNDQIPDTVENQAGLDPLDSTDGNTDLDQDGYSNLVEFKLNTGINDASSKPVKISKLNISFDDGNIAPLYNSQNGWKIDDNGIDSTKGIKSANISGEEQSSVFLTHYFSNGSLSFNHNPNNSDSDYRLKVYIDGELKESFYNSSYDDEWKTRRIAISEGVQTIEFRLEDGSSYPTGNAQHIIDNIIFDLDQDGDSIPDSVDNCPTISNRWQRDDNNNGIGDDCEGPNADDDSDGLQNYRDNCPTIANPDQENIDYDQYGDACDTDIDGDGISNDIEDKYDFLDPRNRNDAALDQDNDGISNSQEIAEGTDPSIYNERKRISLLEYFPLGNIEVKLSSGGSYTIKPAGATGEFILEMSDSPFYQKYRITNKGLEITEVYLPSEQVTVQFDGLVEIPTSMFLGEVKTFSYSGKATGEERVTGLEQRIELYAAGQSEWNGKSYDYITLLQDGSMTTYFKGIGPMYSGSLNSSPPQVQEIKINSLADTSAVSSDSSSGGALSYLWLMSFFALIVLARRQSFRHLPRR